MFRRCFVMLVLMGTCAQAQLFPTTGGFVVDPTSREESRVFFQSVYNASDGVAMGWTGNHATCTAGTLSGDFRDATRIRINYYRAMAGLYADIGENPTNSAKAQDCALMMSRNNALNHYPPTSWHCYTADGEEGALKSNITLDSNGAESVNYFMLGPGASSYIVAHRRWLLFPQTQIMGFGDVARSGAYPQGNAIWVFDEHFWDPRPTVRDGFVAWPPPGYVPYQVVFQRWSFSYEDANFSSATVTMTKNGGAVPVELEPLFNGYGENTIVWVPENLDGDASVNLWPRPTSDVNYTVNINNVIIDGTATNFSYDVTVFDPGTVGPGTVIPAVTGPSPIPVNEASTYTATTIDFTSDYDLRAFEATSHTLTEGAETGLGNVIDGTSPGYDVRTAFFSQSGSYSWRLGHLNDKDQVLTLNKKIIPSVTSSLNVHSKMRWLASEQQGLIQISTDDGQSWKTLYSQNGVNAAGEGSFTLRTFNLSSYANRVVMFRFKLVNQGAYYDVNAAQQIGWFLDNIRVTNAQELGANTVTEFSTTSFDYTPGETGQVGLQVRGRAWSSFPMEWGTINFVDVVEAPMSVNTFFMNFVGDEVRVEFDVLNPSASPSFSIQSCSLTDIVWGAEAGTLTEIIPGTRYRLSVDGGSYSQRMFRVHAAP